MSEETNHSGSDKPAVPSNSLLGQPVTAVLPTCECCGAYITEANPRTVPCDCCERMRCCRCYMGRGTVCPICEENDE